MNTASTDELQMRYDVILKEHLDCQKYLTIGTPSQIFDMNMKIYKKTQKQLNELENKIKKAKKPAVYVYEPEEEYVSENEYESIVNEKGREGMIVTNKKTGKTKKVWC